MYPCFFTVFTICIAKTETFVKSFPAHMVIYTIFLILLWCCNCQAQNNDVYPLLAEFIIACFANETQTTKQGAYDSQSRRHQDETSIEHPLLGWYRGYTPRKYLDVMPHIIQQLRLLWLPYTVNLLFRDVWQQTDMLVDTSTLQPTERRDTRSSASDTTDQIKRKNGSQKASWWSLPTQKLRHMFRLSMMSASSQKFVDAEASIRVAEICKVFKALYRTMRTVRQEILGSLTFSTDLVPRLWTFLHLIGPKGNMQIFLVSSGDFDKEPLLDCLHVCCDTTYVLLTIVEDDEILDQHGNSPLSAEHLKLISSFLNKFILNMIWHRGYACEKGVTKYTQTTIKTNTLVQSCIRLLQLIRALDGRHNFTSPGHWQLREAKTLDLASRYYEEATGTSSNNRATTLLSALPHLLSFHDRVKLLRKLLQYREQHYLSGLPQYRSESVMKIRRSAILTDGFREVMTMGPDGLRESVRVVFVDEHGLPEAGIDERGLFKEFLEETLQEGFNPEFGLFRTTSEGNMLYPSSSSNVHENHLALFEFLGRMVGRMLCDGMVVDLPLAPFFGANVLGINNTLHDLPLLDAELARSLYFVKTYDGDVEELCLTFAVDEEVFGHHITVPLLPGGTAVSVTNSNRFLYVYLLADYRLNKQLSKQAAAFSRGLQHMVPRQWLRFFSPDEVQRLVSGDNAPVNIEDLKQNTQYVGGYTAGHRTVRWFWEIIQNDLSTSEQQQLLRFVTSCSRPPVLGFGTLNPKFTIRCMSDGESENEISARNFVSNLFFRGKSSDRLPTASTCFNMLKLPPYQSKRVLREKLRLAISHNSGFHLI